MKNSGFRKNDYAASVAFIAYSSSVAITPICLIKLMEELSFSMAGGGGIEAVRTVLVVVVLLLSGFAAARWGKSRILIVGSLLLAVGMGAYALAPAYIVVLSAMVFVGLGGGIVEGLVNPLVQDTHPEDSGKYLNIVNAFWSIGVLSSVLISGMLLTRGVSWRYLMAGSSVLGLLSALLLYAFREKKPAATSQNEAANTRQTGTAETWRLTKEILKTKRFRAFAAAMFTGAGAEATFTFWSASYLQIHFQTLPRAGGFGTAFFAAGMIAGRMLSGHYVKQENLRTLILVSATAG
ncbi:MAG: MFS transporter, partial [Spirochaetales bacterium]|nr:MFS transporter [Spirochaetales bacterium]